MRWWIENILRSEPKAAKASFHRRQSQQFHQKYFILFYLASTLSLAYGDCRLICIISLKSIPAVAQIIAIKCAWNNFMCVVGCCLRSSIVSFSLLCDGVLWCYGVSGDALANISTFLVLVLFSLFHSLSFTKLRKKNKKLVVRDCLCRIPERYVFAEQTNWNHVAKII